MHASRGWGTLAPCPAAPTWRQGAWVMRTTHELTHWGNPLTPLGVKGNWVNSEWQVFRWLQHVISTTLDCTLFKVAHVDCCHQVCLLLVLVLLTSNVTEYRRFDLHSAHWPFILVLGLLYPFTYLARIVTGGLLFRLAVQVGALRDDARHAKQTSVLSNLECPVVHILITSVLLLHDKCHAFWFLYLDAHQSPYYHIRYQPNHASLRRRHRSCGWGSGEGPSKC